jgi:hypothetical protein
MDISRPKSAGVNFRHLALGFVFWFILMGLGYVITILRVEHIRNGIRDSGIKTVEALAKDIRIDLLENNAQAIHQKLVGTGDSRNIVYLAVSDHRNEIVAVAGTEKIQAENQGSIQKKRSITFLEGKLPSAKSIISCNSDVSYAGTKIGEIYLALSAGKAETIRNQFLIVALLSLLLFLLFILVQGLRQSNIRLGSLQDLLGRRQRVKPNLEKYCVTCPLCGTPKPVNADIFKYSKFYHKTIMRKANPGINDESQADLMTVDLAEISKRNDFHWIKRQVILRCAEIIQKLTA